MSANTRNLRDGVMKISDGSGSPKSLTIPIMDGDLTFEEHLPSAVIMNRGRIDSRKAGDDKPLTVSFSWKFEQFMYASGNATGMSVRDALTGEGGAVGASWVSVDSCGPWAVDIEIEITNPCAPTEKEILKFPKFHPESLTFKEGKDTDTISTKGDCLAVKPTRTYA